VIIDKDEVVIYRKEPSSFAKRTLLIGGYSPQPRVSSSEAIRIIVEHLSDVTKAPLTSIQQGSIISSADENQSQQLTSIHRSVTFSSVSINYPPEDRPAHNMKKRIEVCICFLFRFYGFKT
jgi:hypothetical protein